MSGGIPWEPIWTIRDVAILLAFAGGIAGGIMLIVRKSVLPGVLILLGFALLAVEPLADLVFFRIMAQAGNADWESLDLAYVITTVPTAFLGAVSLVAAVLILAWAERSHVP